MGVILQMCIRDSADVKIYLTASVATRAKRRYDELREMGEECDYEEIARDIRERDERDMSRETAPLKKAEDAVLIDSSEIDVYKRQTNFLLMHAMGPNVAGVIGTAVAAGTFMAIFGVK